MPNLSGVREKLSASLWFIPAVMVSAASALALTATHSDQDSARRPIVEGIFTGGAESARAILGVVASAVVTFTALVFTITIVALQLSSQQFSPRVLRTFLRDTPSKVALGMFVSTFTYCLLILRALGGSAGVQDPSLSMLILLVLTLASVGMFISYISHMAHSIRVAHIVTAVGDETRALIGRLDAGSPPESADRSLVEHPVSRLLRVRDVGSLITLNHEGLVRLASDAGVVLVMRRAVGDFLAYDQVLAEVRGEGDVDEDQFFPQVAVGIERTMQQDVAFGIRQLVDIAEKALSPGINDPTTAVMALDQVHDVMRRLVSQPPPPAEHYDDRATVRLITKEWSWEGLVHLAFGEVRQFVGSSLQVTRRLMAMLEDLISVAPDDRKVHLVREKKLLAAQARESFAETQDQEAAVQPDPQGIGPTG